MKRRHDAALSCLDAYTDLHARWRVERVHNLDVWHCDGCVRDAEMVLTSAGC